MNVYRTQNTNNEDNRARYRGFEKVYGDYQLNINQPLTNTSIGTLIRM